MERRLRGRCSERQMLLYAIRTKRGNKWAEEQDDRATWNESVFLAVQKRLSSLAKSKKKASVRVWRVDVRSE